MNPRFLLSVLFVCLLWQSGYGQCNQSTNLSANLSSESCPGGTTTYQVSFSSSIPNGNNSLCYGYTVTNPDGSQQTTNIGPVNQSNSANKNWTHAFNVTINCNQGLSLFLSGWSNQNCGGNLCASPISRTLVIAPLPVDLLYFNVRPALDGHLLEWATAREVNNTGFHVDYSPNTRDWQTIGFVAGKGNTHETTTYQFWFDPAEKGYHYYRLQQVDADGQYQYSPVVQGTDETEDQSFQAFVTSSSLIIHSDRNQSLTLFNYLGNRVATYVVQEGKNEIDIQDVPAGVYFLKSDRRIAQKVIKL